MDIVVGVAPTPKLSLETELRLIKPALLCGDRVTLYSPATSLIAMTAAIGELSDDERVDSIAQVLPAVSPDRSEETRTYGPHETFVESGTAPFMVSNESSIENAVVYATLVVPAGSPFRIETDPPPCA